MIEEYVDNIKETTGVGFVIIVDCFDKTKKEVHSINTFFDIESGKLLWVTKTIGEVGGRGKTDYWALGTVISLKTFIDRVYRKSMK